MSEASHRHCSLGLQPERMYSIRSVLLIFVLGLGSAATVMALKRPLWQLRLCLAGRIDGSLKD